MAFFRSTGFLWRHRILGLAPVCSFPLLVFADPMPPVFSIFRQYADPRYLCLFAVLPFTIWFVIESLGFTCRSFLTLFTPSMPFATASARDFCEASATVPFSVITEFTQSTLIVESRRSLSAASAVLVLNHSQLSSMPWPIVLEPLSFSY